MCCVLILDRFQSEKEALPSGPTISFETKVPKTRVSVDAGSQPVYEKMHGRSPGIQFEGTLNCI